jgi:hypothetical protein
MTQTLEKIKIGLREHKAAVVFSVVVGFIMIAPQVFFISSVQNYTGIYMMDTDAEVHYLARMNNFLVRQSTGNPYLYEYKDTISPFDTYSEGALSLPAFLLPVSIPDLSLLYKFLLPCIIFFLAYLFSFRLIRDKKWAIATGLFILLGHNLINIPDIIHLLRFDTSYYNQFSLFSRPVNPEFSSIFLFAYLLVFLRFLKNPKWGSSLTLGIIFGLSFYVYFYSFTFFMALNAVFLVLLAARGKRDVFIKLLSVSVIGLVIGSYEIVNLMQVSHSPFYKEMAELSGLQSSHSPVFSMAGIIVTGLFLSLMFVYRRKWTEDEYFILGLLGTALVVINQQIITGIVLQHGHYHWYFNTPIYILSLLWTLYYFSIQKNIKQKFVTALIVLISVASVYVSVFIQYSSYTYWKHETANDQRIYSAIDWIKTNTKSESVIFSNTKISNLIPIYTRDFVAYSDYGMLYLVPKERRVWDTDTILKNGLDSFRDSYRLDYVVWDKTENPEWNIDKLQYLTSLFNEGGVYIYGFKK